MIVPNYEALADVRKKNIDKTIVVCAGSFDLIHPGHVLFFNDCKKFGDILVVIVGGDYDGRRYKGPKRPILNEQVRMYMVDSLKMVDYVVLQEVDERHLLGSYDRLFSILRPNVYVCNQDVQSEKFKDAADTDYRKQLAEKYGAKFVLLTRECLPEFENISTTKIIKKIVDIHKEEVK